jgi:hypothetical protein
MGVVSDSGKFLFVHIPKNGGLSVYNYLKTHAALQPQDVVVMEGSADPRWFGKTVSLHKHAKASQYQQWCVETGRDWSSYKTFAVVRDPLKRPQSVFNEIRKNADTWGRRNAGQAWWSEFERCENVEDFISARLYTPDGPLAITHRQYDYVTRNDEVIVDDLLPLETVWWSVPALLSTPQHVGRANEGQYVPVKLSDRSIAYIHAYYEDDFYLLQRARKRFHQ